MSEKAMKQELKTAILFTLLSTLGLGIVYPLVVTAAAQAFFPDQANGALRLQGGRIIGSRLLAQPFSSPAYFHPRPSAAGPNGYDPTLSGASQYGPTSQKLVQRVDAAVQDAHTDRPGRVPIDLVTASGSGLDPDITPAAALFQAERVARVRHGSLEEIEGLIGAHTEDRQFGFLGEPRVNVLELNLALDADFPVAH